MSKCRYNRCSQYHVNLKSEFKFYSPSNLRPRYSQASYPKGTSNYKKISNTFHPSYCLVFFLKSKNIHTDTPTRKSDNIPHRGTWEPWFLLKHYLANQNQVKAIIFNTFVMESNKFLFDPVNPKICHFFAYICISFSLVSMARKDRKHCIKPLFWVSQFLN